MSKLVVMKIAVGLTEVFLWVCILIPFGTKYFPFHLYSFLMEENVPFEDSLIFFVMKILLRFLVKMVARKRDRNLFETFQGDESDSGSDFPIEQNKSSEDESEEEYCPPAISRKRPRNRSPRPGFSADPSSSENESISRSSSSESELRRGTKRRATADD